jgi:hypothetical protein
LLTVTGVDSQYADDAYHADDVIHLEDHFNISADIRRVKFGTFPQTRQSANSQTSGQFYSIDAAAAFGIALKQIVDDDRSSLPVRGAAAALATRSPP